MGRKTPPYRHYEKWTEARFFGFIRSALRRAWTKYPVKYQVLRDAESGVKINRFSGKRAKHYVCAECKREFPANMVHVDHINTNHPLKSFSDISPYCETLFCGASSLQVLCNYKGIVEEREACHKIKTREERKRIDN